LFFWDVTPCSLADEKAPEEHISSVFKIDDEVKQATSKHFACSLTSAEFPSET
jgi:hypothetical protein